MGRSSLPQGFARLEATSRHARGRTRAQALIDELPREGPGCRGRRRGAWDNELSTTLNEILDDLEGRLGTTMPCTGQHPGRAPEASALPPSGRALVEILAGGLCCGRVQVNR